MKRHVVLCLAAALLYGCQVVYHQQAYYVSPVNGSSSDYQPLPLHADSAHTAVYARAAYFSGKANDNSTDAVKGGSLSISIAQHFGMVQYYYGLGLSLGDYKMGQWHSESQGVFLFTPNALLKPPFHYRQLDSLGGDRFFGSAAFNGGIDLVAPFDNAEWRFLGVETDLHRDFGDYLSFRKKLSDTLADLIIRTPFFGTVGITSEIIARTPEGELGFRLAKGWIVGAAYQNLSIFDTTDMKVLKYHYFNGSFHYTFRQYTGYFQVDGGTKASSVHIGFVFRFGRPRLAPRALYIRYRRQPATF